MWPEEARLNNSANNSIGNSSQGGLPQTATTTLHPGLPKSRCHSYRGVKPSTSLQMLELSFNGDKLSGWKLSLEKIDMKISSEFAQPVLANWHHTNHRPHLTCQGPPGSVCLASCGVPPRYLASPRSSPPRSPRQIKVASPRPCVTLCHVTSRRVT